GRLQRDGNLSTKESGCCNGGDSSFGLYREAAAAFARRLHVRLAWAGTARPSCRDHVASRLRDVKYIGWLTAALLDIESCRVAPQPAPPRGFAPRESPRAFGALAPKYRSK
ncbi:jg3529, partial [Pararge aegeria aegeria]